MNSVYPLRRQPLDMQRRVLLTTWEMKQVGLIADAGAGREKLIADTISWLYLDDRIERAIIVMPAAVLNHWRNQLVDNILDTINLNLSVWTMPGTGISHTHGWGKHAKPESSKLNIVLIALECIQQKSGHAAQHFMDNFLCDSFGRSMLVVDEAAAIGNPREYRTMALQAVGPLAGYRRILMGTMPRCPLDLWAPYKFLSGDGPHLLGIPSPGAMVQRYRRRAEANGGSDRTDEWFDLFDLESKMWACTAQLDKDKMDDLMGPLRIERDIIYRYLNHAAEAARDTRAKFVVFTHQEVEPLAKMIEKALWAQADEIQGHVVRTHWNDRQVVRQFWQDDRTQALVINAHVPVGTLACANSTIYADSCPEPTCLDNCQRWVDTPENEHTVTHITFKKR